MPQCYDVNKLKMIQYMKLTIKIFCGGNLKKRNNSNGLLMSGRILMQNYTIICGMLQVKKYVNGMKKNHKPINK